MNIYDRLKEWHKQHLNLNAISVYERVHPSEALAFILPKHYAGRKPSVSYAFGVRKGIHLVACVTYGLPASPSLCRGVMGGSYVDRVIELNRLCRIDEYTEPLSKLVAYSLRELGKLDSFCVVSYADTAMTHVGYIYQATNFLYTGISAKRTDVFTGDGKHSRHAKCVEGAPRKNRSSKHRYIMFVGRHRKAMRKHLIYQIKPYPKGESKKYVLGTFIKDNLVD